VRGGVGHTSGSQVREVKGDLASTMSLLEDKVRRWWRTWVRPWAAVDRESWARRCSNNAVRTVGNDAWCTHTWRHCGSWPGGPFWHASLKPVQIGGGPALFKWAGPGNLIKGGFPN
jgi:hypothetical protein